MVQAKAQLNFARISAKKVRLVADAIRGLDAVSAEQRLAVTFKRSAPIVSKLLKSAIANATDRFDVQPSDLIVKDIQVNQGPSMKRWRPAAFGSAHPFKKHTCHIQMTLQAKEGVKAEAKVTEKKEIETVDLTKTDKKVSTTQAPAEKKAGKLGSGLKKASKGISLGKSKDNMGVKKG